MALTPLYPEENYVGYGPELNRDPDCNNAVLWTLGAGWSHGDGQFHHAAGNTATLTCTAIGGAIQVGEVLRLVLTVSARSAGQVRLLVDSISSTYRSAVGTFSEELANASVSATIAIQPSSDFVGSISFASVRKVVAMALTSQGWEMTVTVADNGNGRSNLNFQLVAATAADAATAGSTIRTLLDAVTDMTIMGYTLTERFEDPVAALPAAGVQRENRAKLICNVDGFANKVTTIYIPAPVIGIFQDTTGEAADRVDPTDVDMLAYLNIWQVTGALAKTSDGEYLKDTLPLREGNRTHRQSSFG